MSSISPIYRVKLLLDAVIEEEEYYTEMRRDVLNLACDVYIASKYATRPHCKARERQLRKRNKKYQTY